MTDRRETTDPRFDRWLSRRLHEAYDGVLKEQLPAELDRLVQQLAAHRDDAAVPLRDGSRNEPEPDEEGPAARRRSSMAFAHFAASSYRD